MNYQFNYEYEMNSNKMYNWEKLNVELIFLQHDVQHLTQKNK